MAYGFVALYGLYGLPYVPYGLLTLVGEYELPAELYGLDVES